MPAPAVPDPADDIEERDPGLARERTDLAWTRTAISFAALGAAMLRTNAAAGAVVMMVGSLVWGLGQLSARDFPLSIRRRRLSHQGTVRLITVSTTLVSVVALILALLGPEHR